MTEVLCSLTFDSGLFTLLLMSAWLYHVLFGEKEKAR